MEGEACAGPSTPKRQRLAPPSIPLGLSPGDFDRLEGLRESPVAPTSPAELPLEAKRQNPTPRNLRRRSRPVLAVTTVNPSTYSSSLVSSIVQKLSLGEEWQTGSQSREETIDERWRQLLAGAEMARGLKIRRDMVIRRGRRERTSLEALERVWFAGMD